MRVTCAPVKAIKEAQARSPWSSQLVCRSSCSSSIIKMFSCSKSCQVFRNPLKNAKKIPTMTKTAFNQGLQSTLKAWLRERPRCVWSNHRALRSIRRLSLSEREKSFHLSKLPKFHLMIKKRRWLLSRKWKITIMKVKTWREVLLPGTILASRQTVFIHKVYQARQMTKSVHLQIMRSC